MKLVLIFCIFIFSFRGETKPVSQLKLNPYGKISIMGHVANNDLSIEDSGSRIGLKASKVFKNKIKLGARGEWSLNAVNNTSTLTIGDNNNFVSTKSDKTFNRRLGYIEVDIKEYGVFRFGKQWSVYSDVSHFTDNFNLYGGSSSGTYNLRTDGGQSGTGRVSQAISYRNSLWKFKYGLQAKLIKNRQLSIDDNDVSVVAKDAYGFSLRRDFFKFIEIGIAYNQIDLKGESGAVSGYDGGNSWAAIAGLKLKFSDLVISYVYNRSKNHELDNESTIFDGLGQEFLTNYKLSEAFTIKAGFNHLTSFENDLDNDYKLEHYIAGLSYKPSEEIKLFGEIRLDESRGATGEGSENSLGVGGTLYF